MWMLLLICNCLLTNIKLFNLFIISVVYFKCASVESIVAINTKKLVVLAPQQILDCSQKGYKNQGCDGGYADESFLYVQDQGLEEDATYPYQNKVSEFK